nr:UUP1 family membrane protein [Nostoc flagelliforme]
MTASDVPFLPNQAFNSWYVEAKLSLNSQSSPFSDDEDLPTNIKFHLPQDSQRYEIVKEDFLNRGFTRQVQTLKDSANRVAVFTKEDSADSSKTLFYRAIIRRQNNVDPGSEKVPISGRRLVDKELVRFGKNIERVQDNLAENLPTAEIDSLLREAKKQSSDRLSFAQRIRTYATGTMRAPITST